ncbi:MAG: hypothetical protein M0Z48_08985, partial [Nitrospiraceae bacterium]|nr:hypothetical protein [Nitrospiraceae bacterium]
VMVPSNSAARRVGDLAGDTICFLTGSLAERSLSSYFDTRKKRVRFLFCVFAKRTPSAGTQ